MCADSILRRKHDKRANDLALDKTRRVVITIPTQLLYQTRSRAAMQGERGPGPIIERALVDYLKRNPIPSREL